MTILGLIVFLVIIGLCFWVVGMLGGTFGIPPQIIVVIQVILVVIIILYLLQFAGVGMPGLRLR